MKKLKLVAMLLLVACGPTIPATTRAPSPKLEEPGYRPQFGTMWTFDAPPVDYWKKTYGFAPDQAWLDNARLASVRLPNC
jgi:hypothetical protein